MHVTRVDRQNAMWRRSQPSRRIASDLLHKPILSRQADPHERKCLIGKGPAVTDKDRYRGRSFREYNRRHSNLWLDDLGRKVKGSTMAKYNFRVNHRAVTVESWDPDQPLLYVLRNSLGLHAAKFG